ncbi:sulfite exporter TauE/SafE family protein [Synechococcus sp. PCC 7502]|uniref:sulfite exporter TauE/SafE family protein n=1 Tax=Synechococcus sp. PCC 7502 TaxID=1173263 RepID=UPI001FEEB325|nr:sulfite exporter TauE/SafE family protein [Synechococcus sp. PCC 7502]
MVLSGLILLISGFLAGAITGLLGMGGSLMLVPVMMSLSFEPVQAVGSCSLAMFITTISGSWSNWQSGNLGWQQVLTIGIPALITAQIGVYLASAVSPEFLLLVIALLIAINIYFKLKPVVQNQAKNYITSESKIPETQKFKNLFAFTSLEHLKQIAIGTMAGLISGLVGISGGVVIVPSQILLLQTEYEVAVQTSVGVMILSTGSAFIGHSLNGHVLLKESLILGSSGVLGIQCGTWLLINSRRIVNISSQSVLVILICGYLTWQTLIGVDKQLSLEMSQQRKIPN